MTKQKTRNDMAWTLLVSTILSQDCAQNVHFKGQNYSNNKNWLVKYFYFAKGL